MLLAMAGPVRAEPMREVSAYELIAAMNALRVSYGLPALIEDPIINAVASSTAQTMAANNMSWHIGNVAGRLQSAGYGGGAHVFGTENFAVGSLSIDEIMVIWSDESHMIPAVNPAYCHVGAGVASAGNGSYYYVLQAAYTSSKACGTYGSVAGSGTTGGSVSGAVGVPQLIVPVKVSTPDEKGQIFHEVQAGQSLWSIAIAYKVTIADIETWNNIRREYGLKVGQKLFIPGPNTEGYATPTPVGMVVVQEAGSDGKIVHEVQPYQTLITIAQAYHVDVDTLMALNGWQKDWPLQIGQKLLIGTSSGEGKAVAQAKLSPIQLLTPDGEGRYFHRVKSGETLSGIAGLYQVGVRDLMAWNGLDGSSILYPEEKLLLRVTPPATATSTPAPTQAMKQVSLSITGTPTPTAAAVAAAPENGGGMSGEQVFWLVVLGMIVGGAGLIVVSMRKRV